MSIRITFLSMLIFFFLLLFGSKKVLGQDAFKGKVIDAQNHAPLYGVHVRSTLTGRGDATDISGVFRMQLSGSAEQVEFSYTGYERLKVQAQPGDTTIRLKPLRMELNQLVVSASQERQKRTEVPMAIRSIPASRLNETRPTELDEVLNQVSGVQMVPFGNEQHAMSIRQPLSHKALFLYMVDGIPIRPTGIFNHNALIEMNHTAVDHIEIVKGPASSIYGSEAVGGAVNFFTRRPPVDPEFSLSLRGDDLGYKRIDTEGGGTVGKWGLYAGGYFANRRNGYREHSEYDKSTFTIRADRPIGDGTHFTFTATGTDYLSDMTGSLDSANFYAKNYTSLQTFTSRDIESLRSRATLSHFWNMDAHSELTLYFRANKVGQIPSYRIKNNWWNSTHARGEKNEKTFQSYGMLLRHRQEISLWETTLSGGMQFEMTPNDYWARYIDIDRNQEGVYTSFQTTDSLLSDYHIDLSNAAMYLQVKVNPVSPLHIVAGLRYDHLNYNYENYLQPGSYSGAPDQENGFDHFTPKVGATWNFSELSGLYANYSVGFLPPQVTELYTGVEVPTLDPSTYYNYEAGGWLSFAGDKGYLELGLYQMDGTNEIISVQLDDGSRENRNAGKTRHTGLEYTLRYRINPELTVRLGGTYARHEYVDYVENGRDYSGNEMSRAPEWMANGTLAYRPMWLDGARVDLQWQHIDPYYMDSANSQTYEGYDLFHLRMGYRLGAVETWLNIQNMIDELYATSARKSAWGELYSPGDPRSFTMGITYHLGLE